jgi:hypothetical protein
MRFSNDWHKKQIACGLAILLSFPLSEAAAAPLQPVFQTQESQSADVTAVKADPDASETSKQTSEQVPNAPSPIPVGEADSPSATPTPEAQQSAPTVPVGTAAAPYEKPIGAAVARPVGAAIAPAKQKRSRSFKIRIAIVVGTAVAVGTVVALSMASPSKAH